MTDGEDPHGKADGCSPDVPKLPIRDLRFLGPGGTHERGARRAVVISRASSLLQGLRIGYDMTTVTRTFSRPGQNNDLTHQHTSVVSIGQSGYPILLPIHTTVTHRASTWV